MSECNTNPVFDLIEKDLKPTLQSIANVSNVLMVYSDKDLMDVVKGTHGTTIGIIYEGTRSSPENKPSNRVGVSAETTVSLAIVYKQHMLGSKVPKEYVLSVLDACRKKLMGKPSHTGHKWRFLLEAPAAEKEGTVVWLQRWSTPIQLTPGN